MKRVLRLICSEPTAQLFFTAIQKVSITNISAMAKRVRYFVNPYKLDNEPIENYKADLKFVCEELLPNTVEIITRSVHPESACSEGELYVGAAGIAYAFYHAGRVLPTSLSLHYQQLAQSYLQPAIRAVNRRGNHLNSAFLCGHAGVIAVAAAIASAAGDTRQSESLGKLYADLSEICKPMVFLRGGSDEFFVGRAGYLYGALWLNKKLEKEVVGLDIMHDLAKTIVVSGQKYAVKNKSPCPLMYSYYGTEYLGAAHGLSSILQILIQVPGFLDNNKEADELVRRCVNFMLSIETPSGNYPCALDEIGPNSRPEEEELVHWCHGAPGVVYLLAAAYRRWQDSRYLQACLRAGDLVWRRGLLKKGPGICHGIAGSGYVFLLLYRLTGDTVHLRRAAKFARFLKSQEFERSARTPDVPYSLYEGLAGTLCFLADLGRPEVAAFPFQDPFL